MIKKLTKRIKSGSINEETILVGIIFVLSSYMLYEAQSFGTASQRFPELASAATAVIAGLLLVSNFLPPRVKELLFPDHGANSGGMFEDDSDGEDTTNTESISPKIGKFGIHGGLFTGILTIAFASLGLMFGFLLVTPLFIAIYLYWFDHPWYSVVGMALLGLIVTYVFITIFRVPLNDGIIMGVVV